MQRIALIIFVSFELLYYLLIAQTGIVEYFNAELSQIIYLPIAGVMGAIFVMFCTLPRKTLLLGLLGLQVIMSAFYPDFTHLGLVLLGLSVGGIAPLLIHSLKQQKHFDMGFALIIAYGVGTFLFSYPPSQRGVFALGFSLVALVGASVLSMKDKQIDAHKKLDHKQLLMMSLWVFFDASLFETLSRESVIPIWRGDYTLEIIIFHILGVLGAFYMPVKKEFHTAVILTLLSVSYLLYFSTQPLLLSFVYPFVISYYNVIILQTLIRVKDFKQIVIAMIMIGWVSSGAGLMVALNEFIVFVPVIFITLFAYIIYAQSHFKEIHYV